MRWRIFRGHRSSLPIEEGCPRDPAGRELELTQLVRGERAILWRSRGLQRQPHRSERPENVSLELPRIRNPRVRRKLRMEVHHVLDGGEGPPIEAELDLRVPDHAVDVVVVRIDRAAAPAPRERSREVVPGQGERPLPHVRVEVVTAPQGQGPGQGPLRLRVVAGIGRHASLLNVGQAQRGPRAPVRRQCSQPSLETSDLLGKRSRENGRARSSGRRPDRRLRPLPQPIAGAVPQPHSAQREHGDRQSHDQRRSHGAAGPAGGRGGRPRLPSLEHPSGDRHCSSPPQT